MVIRDELTRTVECFKENGIENAIFEANLIFRHFLNMSPLDIVLKSSEEIPKTEYSQIQNAIKRRVNGEPIQYILNSQEFMGLDFYVDSSVLVPRQDTECLVECILEKYANRGFSALDLCTGSGCIAISLAHFNKKGYIKGIDISKDAIKVAKKNAKKLDVEMQVEFEVCDVFEYISFGKYDFVVSNPPYIESETIEKLDSVVKDYEPEKALDGGKDGLDFYRHIVNIAPKILNPDGMLFFEIGFNQGNKVKKLMENSFSNIRIIKDLSGLDRVVCGKIK